MFASVDFRLGMLCFALFVDSHNSIETRAAMLLMLMIWLFHIVARTVVQSCHPCSNEKNRDEKYILRQSAKLLCFGIVISLSHFGQPRAHYASIEHLANILCELCAFVSVSVWVDVCALVLLYAFLLNTCTLCVCVYTSCIRINRLVIRPTILYVQHIRVCIALLRFSSHHFSLCMFASLLLFPIRTSSVCSGVTFAAYCPIMIVCMCNFYTCLHTYPL